LLTLTSNYSNSLGDSGYVHISPFRLSHISEPQTHAFNTPYQLSKVPPRVVAQLQLFGGVQHHSERPADADVYSHPLTHGDALVFATDGVWDNLSPEDVLRIVSHVNVAAKCWVMGEEGAVGVNPEFSTIAGELGDGQSGESVMGLSTILAMAITREAKEASLNKKRDGPFAKEVRRRYPMENYRGGKPDDICTVVAVVVEDGL
jgi:protein phosphatase PTC7